MNTIVLVALKTKAEARTSRRPTWSDERPAKRRVTRTPTAYEAKMTEMIAEEKCH